MSEWSRGAGVLGAFAVVVVGFLAALGGAQQAPPSGPNNAGANNAPADNRAPQPESVQEKRYLRVAFVNIKRVLLSYDVYTDGKADLDEEARDKQAELEALQKEIDKFKKQIDDDPRGLTPENFRLYAGKVNRLKRNTQLAENVLNVMHRRLLKQAYDDAYEAIRKVAAKRGYDVVYGTDEKEIRTGTPEEFFQKIVGRSVFVWPAADDLTAAVVRQLREDEEDESDLPVPGDNAPAGNRPATNSGAPPANNG